jgi:hypothetical protein
MGTKPPSPADHSRSPADPAMSDRIPQADIHIVDRQFVVYFT